MEFQMCRQWSLLFSYVISLHFLTCRAVALSNNGSSSLPKMHTLFSVECNNYFDWQTIGLMNSYRKSGHPGPITRLLSCNSDDLARYKGMDLAPTHVVPSWSRHPKTGDWYPAINKPAGVVHWLENNPEAHDVEWVVILDADMIIRHPIVPWVLGAKKGEPVAALYGYLIGCDNILAKLHTIHPELCDKVGGLLAMHMDDLRALAPLWLSKTEEVRADKDHWATNITGDIYAQGWISEMYGYSFGAAEVGLRHQIRNDLMIYPGYVPLEGTEPILLHYGLRFSVGNWSFSKYDHLDDDITYKCNRLFTPPPYPKEVLEMESDNNKRRGLFLSLECVNTLNEGLLEQHRSIGCSSPPKSRYIKFLRAWRKLPVFAASKTMEASVEEMDEGSKEVPLKTNKHQYEQKSSYPKIHTLFSVECSSYFDWQTVGLVHSFEKSGQPGTITRLLSCTDEQLKTYKGLDLAPTHVVPSYSLHPLTNDWYPAINKPAAVLHWLNHVETDAEYLVILDADMIIRGPITPWEFGAEKGHPVSAPYDYLIGCDNLLAKLHTRYPEACDKVGGVIIMHIDDLRAFAPLWLHKTEEVRADKAHWATNITGDVYGQGWISEMYGYSFGAAELKLRHRIRDDIMLYPGYIPHRDSDPRLLHYGLAFSVGSWSFDKAEWREEDMTNKCWNFFPDPPDAASLNYTDMDEVRRDTLSIECIQTINNALFLHHKKRGCPDATLGGQNDVGELMDSNSNLNGTVETLKFNEAKLFKKYANTPIHRFSSPIDVMGLFQVKPSYWVVLLWALVVFIFLLMLYSLYSNDGQKQKSIKSKSKRSLVNTTSKENGADV